MSAPFGAIVELPKVLRCGSRAASELLFFARAKKSNQKKRAPNRATAPGPDSLLGPTLSHAASCREGKSRTSMYATLRAFPKREPGPGALHGDLTFRTAATTALTSSSPLPVARPNGLLPLTLNPRRARPSAVAFWVSAPQGSPPWMAATIPRGRKPRGIARAPKGHSTWELSRVFGGVFLLGTFLCTSKEQYLARGARTAIINLINSTIARSANNYSFRRQTKNVHTTTKRKTANHTNVHSGIDNPKKLHCTALHSPVPRKIAGHARLNGSSSR